MPRSYVGPSETVGTLRRDWPNRELMLTLGPGLKTKPIVHGHLSLAKSPSLRPPSDIFLTLGKDIIVWN
jgi:hypothetical protein